MYRRIAVALCVLFVVVESFPSFHHNNIQNNSATYFFKNLNPESLGTLTVENNYWGTTDETEIDSKICDYFEDITKGVVDFRPILTTPEPGAGPQ